MRLLDLILDPVRGPLALALAVALLRVVYAVLSRVVAPFPRIRAAVEAVAALAPDLLRSALQLVAALTGRPAFTLDARGPDPRVEERAAHLATVEVRGLRAIVADLSDERDALARRVAELTAGEGDTVRPTVVPGEPRPQATTTRHRIVRPPEVDAAPDEATAGHPDGVRGAL